MKCWIIERMFDNSGKDSPVLRELDSGDGGWVVGRKENKEGNKQGRYSSPLWWSHVSFVHM